MKKELGAILVLYFQLNKNNRVTCTASTFPSPSCYAFRHSLHTHMLEIRDNDFFKQRISENITLLDTPFIKVPGSWVISERSWGQVFDCSSVPLTDGLRKQQCLSHTSV